MTRSRDRPRSPVDSRTAKISLAPLWRLSDTNQTQPARNLITPPQTAPASVLRAGNIYPSSHRSGPVKLCRPSARSARSRLPIFPERFFPSGAANSCGLQSNAGLEILAHGRIIDQAFEQNFDFLHARADGARRLNKNFQMREVSYEST